MHILIADNDVKMANYLRHGLTEKGYLTEVARRGDDAAKMLSETPYDLLLLEVDLPVLDGFALLEKLELDGPDHFQHTKILFIASNNTLENRLRALNLGADDFLGKPFAFAELVARVQALLRRGRREAQGPGNQFCISDLCVDIERQMAWRQDRSLPLTAKEFSLLAALARRPGKIFTRTLLEELVWGYQFECEANIVDVTIRRLRKKVDDPFEKKLIHTRRGLGYVLEAGDAMTRGLEVKHAS